MENRKDMVCITCPLGCRLSVQIIAEGELSVSGNKCARGERYATEELLNPRRTVTATCASLQSDTGERPMRIPVRSTAPFPKDRIADLLALIYETGLPLPVERGQVAIADALGLGVDIVVTRTIRC